MPKKEPVGNLQNLFILSQLQYPLMVLLLPSLVLFSAVFVTVGIALSYCDEGNYLPLNRAGTVIGIIAFLYVLVEEVWKLTPRPVTDEIEGSFLWINLEEHPESAEPLRKFRAFAAWAEYAHKPIARSLEALLVIGGGLLSGFGDLIGPYL